MIQVRFISDIQAEGWEPLFADLGLVVTLRGGVASLPGASHWHLKSPGEKGVLEVTWHGNEVTLKVAQNRDGPWQAGVMERMKAMLSSPSTP